MIQVGRYASSTGNVLALRTDGLRWDVVNFTVDGEVAWTETSVSGDHPFTEDEARTEFTRWRV